MAPDVTAEACARFTSIGGKAYEVAGLVDACIGVDRAKINPKLPSSPPDIMSVVSGLTG